jgi:hypothetical protein
MLESSRAACYNRGMSEDQKPPKDGLDWLPMWATWLLAAGIGVYIVALNILAIVTVFFPKSSG